MGSAKLSLYTAGTKVPCVLELRSLKERDERIFYCGSDHMTPPPVEYAVAVPVRNPFLTVPFRHYCDTVGTLTNSYPGIHRRLAKINLV